MSLLFVAGHFAAGALQAESVVVRDAEGVVRGFLVLRSLDSGVVIANGDLIQFSRGDRVTSRLVFHFKDGSLQDETAVFTQRGRFRLLRDHRVVIDSAALILAGALVLRRTPGHVAHDSARHTTTDFSAS